MKRTFRGALSGAALFIGQLALAASDVAPPAGVSDEQEVVIGAGIASRVLGGVPLVDNSDAQKLVNQAGMWLAMQTDRAALPWHFGIVDSGAIHAFALPGGTVLITRGLYRKLHNEAELAGVLSHEIALEIRHHPINAIQQQLGDDWLKAVVKQGKHHHGDFAQTPECEKAIAAGVELLVTSEDATQTFDADQLAVVIAARAGYNPFGLVGFLQTLNAINPDDSAVSTLKTLPTPGSRIAQLQKVMGYRLDQLPHIVSDTTRFDLVHLKK